VAGGTVKCFGVRKKKVDYLISCKEIFGNAMIADNGSARIVIWYGMIGTILKAVPNAPKNGV